MTASTLLTAEDLAVAHIEMLAAFLVGNLLLSDVEAQAAIVKGFILVGESLETDLALSDFIVTH